MNNDITGRDDYIIAEALFFAIRHIDTLPAKHRPESDQQDMRTILHERYAKLAKDFEISIPKSVGRSVVGIVGRS